LPADIPEVKLGDDFMATLVTATEESKSQLKRLLSEGAVKVNGEKVENENYELKAGDKVQIGKKRWYSIT
jgi:tyrosyl-tRNA synthetase